MFTGLVESVGKVVAAVPGAGSKRLAVAWEGAAGGFRRGESVCVDGVCLTVASASADRLEADVVAETLARTTLGRLRPGGRVNLERALRLGDRIGGHLVQGHVDGVIRVAEVVRRGADRRLRLELPQDLARYVAPQGSIAISGVSLTVAAVGRGRFEVVLVPETLRSTTLRDLRAGARVNVEVDLVARYLERLATPGRRGAGGSRTGRREERGAR